MEQEYLLKPVIEVEDGDELKAFAPYYLFLVAFFFGLLPAVFLSVKNCLWLRVSRKIILLILVLSSIAFAGKFIYLGIYYSANHEQLRGTETREAERKSAPQRLKEAIDKNKEEQKVEASPEMTEWESRKDAARMFDRVFGMTMALMAFFIYRSSYRVAKNLTGGIRPMFKWGVGIVVASALLELMISQIFFGGSL